MRCALCDSPARHGWEHDRENYAVREWRRPMLRAHTDMILRMRPLGLPDEDCTDENHRGWDRPPDDELPWSETNHDGYTDNGGERTSMTDEREPRRR